MTDTRGSSVKKIAAVFLMSVALSVASIRVASAQKALSVAVTPPLFQLTIGPGEFWASSIKIVNSNPYDVTYYTALADFEAKGEEGQSKFTPLLNEVNDPTRKTFSLASWVTIGNEPIFVPAGTSGNIPFSVRVPKDAEPGGHYAAILVGTEPPPEVGSGAQVKVSSFVSSLLFVKVKGDITESGRIREFTTAEQIYDTSKADFVLRFENTGNTHLKPQGSIVIYNMWGKPRGSIEINKENNFGNVLPKSIRKFEFSWGAEANAFEIGRYSAVVTLVFGEDNKQNISATNYFWVIPIVPVAIALGLIVIFVLMIMFFVRRYIKRALALEKAGTRVPSGLGTPLVPPRVMETFIEPIREGIIDLRKVTAKVEARKTPTMVAPNLYRTRPIPMPLHATDSDETMTLLEFIVEYKVFMAFVVLVVVASMVVWVYFHKVLTPSREFEITGVTTQEEKIPIVNAATNN